MAEGEQNEKKIFNALNVYKDRGAYLRKLELYEKSKAAYDEAYKYGPDDIQVLIGRSMTSGVSPEGQACCMEDATRALQLLPRNVIALNVQANALFTMGEFEKSTMMNYRGARARKQPAYFIDGINRGEAVIQECIGKGGGQVMSEFLPIIKKQEACLSSSHDRVQKTTHVSRVPAPECKVKLSQLETRRHELLSRVLAMKYLGPMAYDKFFLQELAKDPAIDSANSKGSKELRKVINDALESLSARQEMLRTQRPYYAVRLAEKTVSKYQTKYKKQLLINERKTNTNTAHVLLNKVEKCMLSNNVKNMLKYAEQLQSFLDTKSAHSLPDIQIVTDRLYRTLGKGLLRQNRLSYTLSQKSNERRVAFLMGLYTSRPTSYDSVMATYPYQYLEPKVAYEKMYKRYEICENDFMRCWILYELARLSTILKNYALGKFYAKQCQRQAQQLDCPSWWLNGCIVLLGADMQQGNINEVSKAAEEAYRWAQKSDDEKIQAFLKKCVDMVSEVITHDKNRDIIRREKAIVSIIDKKDRTKAELLLKRISRVPEGRRFYVLPQKREAETARVSVRQKVRQGGLSIIQGPIKPVHIAPKSKILGYQEFQI